MKITKGQTFTQPHDTKVPVMFTGNTKLTVEVGVDVTWFEFEEVVTKENKNWCKGETFWSTGTNFF